MKKGPRLNKRMVIEKAENVRSKVMKMHIVERSILTMNDFTESI